MKLFFKKVNKQSRGFTLVETLVAISIFTMSILALLVVLSQGIANTNYAKTKTIASYLGQEGIEYIRNLRDTYMLYDVGGGNAGWSSFRNRMITGCNGSGGCYVNGDGLNYSDISQPMIDVVITKCTGNSCPPLLYDATTGEYGYTVGVDSGFVRKISMDQINNDEIQISSTVYWIQGSGTYDMTFSENLFNWIE